MVDKAGAFQSFALGHRIDGRVDFAEIERGEGVGCRHAGRSAAKRSNEVAKRPGGTHPHAVEAVGTGRYLTLSEDVLCGKRRCHEQLDVPLLHFLLYASRHLADQLGASPVFRADGNYELGELLPSVLSRVT